MNVSPASLGPLVGRGTPEGAQVLQVRGMRQGRAFFANDWVADEVPVALEYNGIAHAVMLATPFDLEDFALGFSLSEGILDTPSQLYSVEQTASARGITVNMQVASACFARLKHRRRSMAGRTGCGLCGTESLEQVARSLPKLGVPLRPDREAIARAMRALPKRQMLQQATGAVHAAAWCSPQGSIADVREDVGRHNAVDKLIGALSSRKTIAATPDAAPPAGSSDGASNGFFIVTSRASFEMVQKTVMAGVTLLAAVSAPTTLAIDMAQRSGLTLVGFARNSDLVVYTYPERLGL